MVLRPAVQTGCRVISAEAKTPQPPCHQSRVQLAGVIEVVGGGRHYAEVREGALVLHAAAGAGSAPRWRIPLRGLHLLQAPPPLAFTLSAPADARPAVTFQAGSEWEYERWVKCLAVELMRQTPLERIRFLDILGITHTLRRARSASSLSSPPCTLPAPSPPPPPPQPLVYRKRNQAQLPDVVRDLPPCTRRSRSRKKELRPTSKPALRGHSLEPANLDNANPQVADLLTKCQRGDVYVPVKEKRLLFEWLWKRSTEPMSRSQSLHDLSPRHNPVRDIARYFESKCSPELLHDVGISLENMVEGERRFPTEFRISNKLSSKFSSLCDPSTTR